MGFKVKLKKDAQEDRKRYLALKALIDHTKDVCYRNQTRPCDKLITLSCMLYIEQGIYAKYLEKSEVDSFLNKFWLSEKRKIMPNLKKYNFFTIAKEKECNNSSCKERIIKQYCK